jgi:hypothetical protein
MSTATYSEYVEEPLSEKDSETFQKIYDDYQELMRSPAECSESQLAFFRKEEEARKKKLAVFTEAFSTLRTRSPPSILGVVEPRFPTVDPYVVVLPKTEREKLRIEISQKTFCVTREELMSTRDAWKPRRGPVDARTEQDEICFLFISAYRATVKLLFGINILQSWNPLQPFYKNGKKNPTPTKFADIVSHFAVNKICTPHGWFRFRMTGMWTHGTLGKMKSKAALEKQLSKYSTFLWVLNGRDALTSPPTYKHFTTAHKGGYSNGFLQPTRSKAKMRRCFPETLDRLQETHRFKSDDFDSMVEEARTAILEDGYQLRYDALLVSSAQQLANIEDRYEKLSRKGEWMWMWPACQVGSFFKQEVESLGKGG